MVYKAKTLNLVPVNNSDLKVHVHVIAGAVIFLAYTNSSTLLYTVIYIIYGIMNTCKLERL